LAGNLPSAQTERNARRIYELAGRSDILVYAGCGRPLMRPLATAEAVHAETDRDRLLLPEPTMPLQAQHGVDFLIERLRSAESGTITLCALGPLTNIAVAVAKAPEIAGMIGELVVMGGACFELGNVTPAAEFNIHVDPHAAALVVDSGIRITMIPLDVTHQCVAVVRECGVPLMVGFNRRFDQLRAVRAPNPRRPPRIVDDHEPRSRSAADRICAPLGQAVPRYDDPRFRHGAVAP
jgi:purine nucleosidase